MSPKVFQWILWPKYMYKNLRYGPKSLTGGFSRKSIFFIFEIFFAIRVLCYNRNLNFDLGLRIYFHWHSRKIFHFMILTDLVMFCTLPRPKNDIFLNWPMWYLLRHVPKVQIACAMELKPHLHNDDDLWKQIYIFCIENFLTATTLVHICSEILYLGTGA